MGGCRSGSTGSERRVGRRWVGLRGDGTRLLEAGLDSPVAITGGGGGDVGGDGGDTRNGLEDQ